MCDAIAVKVKYLLVIRGLPGSELLRWKCGRGIGNFIATESDKCFFFNELHQYIVT